MPDRNGDSALKMFAWMCVAVVLWPVVLLVDGLCDLRVKWMFYRWLAEQTARR